MRMIKYILMGLCLIAMHSHAEPVVTAEMAAPLTSSKSVRYFDGKQWREVWLSENEIAEFLPVPDVKSKARSMLPGAKLLRAGKQMRIWRFDTSIDAQTFNQSTKRSVIIGESPRSKFSPVFRRSVKGGPKMALKGGVIVRFKADWTEEMISAWVAEKDLGERKRLNASSRTYVFNVDAGLAALEKANDIQRSGDVEFAMPQWSRNVYKK